jgi:riboflavin biosynthesis pyrimidine reductase
VTARFDRLWPDPAENLTDDDLTSGLAAGVRVNFISSVDGAATSDGLSGGLSTPGDKRYFELLRRVCDVVVVGAGTVRAEGYGPIRVSAASAEWRTARGMPPHPSFAIVSGQLDLDPRSRIFTDAPVRPILVTTSHAKGAERFAPVADILVAGGGKHIAPEAMLVGLRERNLTHVLCEGGPSLFGYFLDADIVDELCLTISPSLEVGDAPRISSGPAVSRALRLDQVHKSGDSLFLHYVRSEGST